MSSRRRSKRLASLNAPKPAESSEKDPPASTTRKTRSSRRKSTRTPARPPPAKKRRSSTATGKGQGRLNAGRGRRRSRKQKIEEEEEEEKEEVQTMDDKEQEDSPAQKRTRGRPRRASRRVSTRSKKHQEEEVAEEDADDQVIKEEEEEEEASVPKRGRGRSRRSMAKSHKPSTKPKSTLKPTRRSSRRHKQKAAADEKEEDDAPAPAEEELKDENPLVLPSSHRRGRRSSKRVRSVAKKAATTTKTPVPSKRPAKSSREPKRSKRKHLVQKFRRNDQAEALYSGSWHSIVIMEVEQRAEDFYYLVRWVRNSKDQGETVSSTVPQEHIRQGQREDGSENAEMEMEEGEAADEKGGGLKPDDDDDDSNFGTRAKETTTATAGDDVAAGVGLRADCEEEEGLGQPPPNIELLDRYEDEEAAIGVSRSRSLPEKDDEGLTDTPPMEMQQPEEEEEGDGKNAADSATLFDATSPAPNVGSATQQQQQQLQQQQQQPNAQPPLSSRIIRKTLSFITSPSRAVRALPLPTSPVVVRRPSSTSIGHAVAIGALVSLLARAFLHLDHFSVFLLFALAPAYAKKAFYGDSALIALLCYALLAFEAPLLWRTRVGDVMSMCYRLGFCREEVWLLQAIVRVSSEALALCGSPYCLGPLAIFWAYCCNQNNNNTRPINLFAYVCCGAIAATLVAFMINGLLTLLYFLIFDSAHIVGTIAW
eukprot:jgi/Bigna1/141859/aug1.65_g16567